MAFAGSSGRLADYLGPSHGEACTVADPARFHLQLALGAGLAVMFGCLLWALLRCQ